MVTGGLEEAREILKQRRKKRDIRWIARERGIESPSRFNVQKVSRAKKEKC